MEGVRSPRGGEGLSSGALALEPSQSQHPALALPGPACRSLTTSEVYGLGVEGVGSQLRFRVQGLGIQCVGPQLRFSLQAGPGSQALGASVFKHWQCLGMQGQCLQARVDPTADV